MLRILLTIEILFSEKQTFFNIYIYKDFCDSKSLQQRKNDVYA